MGVNILFWPDVNYEPGHWLPVISMAQKIRKNIDGCAIKFLCTPECKPIVTNVKKAIGSTKNYARLFGDNEIITILEDLFPVGYSSLASEKPEEARSRIDHCLKIADGKFEHVFENVKPDLLVAGYFVSMEALLLKYWYDTNIRSANDPEMKIVITTTYLRHPAEDPAVTSLRFLAHHAQEHSSRLMQTVTGDQGYNGSFSSIQDFVRPLETVPELITCPKELDHDYFKHPAEGVYVHYVEPCILNNGEDCLPDPPKDPKLIYASAGSRVRDYVEDAKTMFRMLKDAIYTPQASIMRRSLEMAVGYTLKEDFDKEKSNNTNRIKIIDWADQTASLKRAGSAVIHGGLATIKECIYFGIAPIVIPLGKDQMDNALRVVNKEVGTMMMLDTLTPESLYNAILDAEKNADIQKSMGKMQQKFRDDEAEARSVELIKTELGIV